MKIAALLLICPCVGAFYAHQNVRVQYNSRMVKPKALHMQFDTQKAEMKDWLGVGDGVNIISTDATSPYGVISSYWDSIGDSDQETVIIVPECAYAAGGETIAQLLKSNCANFEAVYHPESEENSFKAPYFSIHHRNPKQGAAAAAARDLIPPEKLPSNEDVMELVIGWFQAQLLGFGDEEEDDFIDLGRKLLTVKEYCVTPAATPSALAAEFWKQAQKLSQPGAWIDKSTQEENSILVVAPNLAHMSRKEFFAMADQQFGRLKDLPSGPDSAVLFVERWASKSLKYPMVLIYPQLVDLSENVPEDGGVVSFSDVLKSCGVEKVEETEDNSKGSETETK